MRVTINTTTSGKYTQRVINGRSHIQTDMMPIRGDTSMNGLFYSDKQVAASFNQLHDLPAPCGHPKINGVHVSAFKPVSMNAFNVGGFTLNPKKKGKEVHVDFLIDETVANTSDDGKEIIRRIKAGEKIGVSTGLTIDKVFPNNGEDDFGVKFNQEGEGFSFDHTAILLDEKAAGDHAGTELKLNTEDPNDPIFVVNLAVINDVTCDDIRDKLHGMIQSADDDIFRWVVEIFPESHQFIWSEESPGNKASRLFKQSYSVSSTDELSILELPTEVKLTKEFKPTITNEDLEMDQTKLVLAIIGLTTNNLSGEDTKRLMKMSESDLIDEVARNTDNGTSLAHAKKALIADGFDFDSYDKYQLNAKKFNAFVEAEEARIDEIKTSITAANSEYTEAMLKGKSEEELLVINKMIEGTPKHAVRARKGVAPVINSNAADSCDYVM